MVYLDNDSVLIFSEPKAYKVRHIKKHKNVALHFNTADAKGEQDVIVFAGEATLDWNGPSPHEVPAYVKKYKTGITDLEMSSEEMGNKYSVAIRDQTEISTWLVETTDGHFVQ